MAAHLESPYECEALAILRFRHLGHFRKPGDFEDIYISKILHSVPRCRTGQWMSSTAAENINHGWWSLGACSSVFYILFYSILFHSILSYYRITTHHNLVHVVALERGQFFAVHCFCLHGVCITWTLTNHNFRLPLKVDENCILLGYYAVSSGNSLPTFWGSLLVHWRLDW